jgi:hypothetical protein
MKTVSLKPLTVSAVLIATLATAGCSTTTGTHSTTRALMDAAAGALIGSLSAQAGTGALIGFGVGALGGDLYDQYKKGNLD